MQPAKSLAQYLIDGRASLREAMERLDQVSLLYVRDAAGSVVGCVGEAEARHAVLSGVALDAEIAMWNTANDFAFVSPEVSRVNALELMEARRLAQLAVVDSARHLSAVHLRDALVGVESLSARAVVMAGGRGSRLYPLTERTPKPMLLVAGRPILERLVLHLVGHGITQIYLAINYLGAEIEQHFGDGRRFGCHIEYLREKQPLGTGGALSLLSPDSNTTLVLNGDLVTQIDILSLLGTHRSGRHAATMGVRKFPITVPFGVVDVEDGRIVRLREKPTFDHLANAGVYVLEQQALDLIPRDVAFPITDLFERCIQRGASVGAHLIEEEWIDVGEIGSLLRARGAG